MGSPLKIIVLVIALIVIVTLVLRLMYPGKPPIGLPQGSCDAGLWKHVYDPQRLKVIEACTAVEGRVVAVRQARDGDMHIRLKVDNRSLLNIYNLFHAHGDLVVESICAGTPAGKDAIAACAGFTPRVTIPRVGDRVRVIGSYVTDLENKLNEIHPVTRIEVLP